MTKSGAQRVAFTGLWAGAREWLQSKAAAIPAETHRDEAGNFWATLHGTSEKTLLIGGHIDSVPNGGWLDGCLNTLAGLEILRRIAAEYKGKPPVTVRLVDWADEEGARFGKSLFGSSACSGNLDMAEARVLKDKEGVSLPNALQQHAIDFEKVKDCGKEARANAAAYLELHIEQGPVPARSRSPVRHRARNLRRRAACYASPSTDKLPIPAARRWIVAKMRSSPRRK